ncbi:hypothetical protein ASD04_04180 [Devosia sp. Root436]|uniref:hypothetical protein n=1 Tax=Devosia sp. Root436 TaxID=1736537 RepID=UPI0006FB9402|nr:hypothetical protein [Devosia sp. Root436]KQX39856.1 hypothetical protein ASD04_04180 [Devosia sp. Root436]
MITAIAADPIISSSGLAGYRTRPNLGERSLLPDSPPPAPKNSGASDNGTFPQHDTPAEPLPKQDAESFGVASLFAAAVIAGKMPPVPTTMEELIMRIGSIPLPPESEARIKDLLA